MITNHYNYRTYNSTLYAFVSKAQCWLIKERASTETLLLGASTGVPTHDKGHVERPDMQRQARTQGGPWICLSIYPQNQNLSVLLFYDFHQLL